MLIVDPRRNKNASKRHISLYINGLAFNGLIPYVSSCQINLQMYNKEKSKMTNVGWGIYENITNYFSQTKLNILIFLYSKIKQSYVPNKMLRKIRDERSRRRRAVTIEDKRDNSKLPRKLNVGTPSHSNSYSISLGNLVCLLFLTLSFN